MALNNFSLRILSCTGTVLTDELYGYGGVEAVICKFCPAISALAAL